MRRSTKRRLAVAAVATLLAGGALSVAYAGNFVSEADYDFDCDGIRDGVVAHNTDEVNGVEGAGSVTVRYSGNGVAHKITQATPGVPGTPEKDDMFGWAHTAYDRNSDGCDDLVVGAPYEGIGSAHAAGMVWVIPGSPSGLDTTRSAGYTQNSSGYAGVPEEWDWFGKSLAAGVTRQGTPYLLIGAPGEGGDSSWLWDHGIVYYVRSGSVAVIHQDSPGVAGKRETGDYFGDTLAVSDTYFVVGVPEETLKGDRWTSPSAGASGMVHVFSHTLTSGRPTAVGAFHQDTAGISGTAEWGDLFGWSVSVVPYRPSASSAVGALVAVGSWETVGTRSEAGMAHLVYVSPGGSVRQIAAITQNTPGVTGTAESGDYLGYDVAVANLNPDSTVAEPDTAAWAVAVGFEETARGNTGAAHVFRATWQPGTSDIWLEAGTYGLPADRPYEITRSRASASHLHLAGQGLCYAVPWRNMLDVGEWQPVVERQDDCR